MYGQEQMAADEAELLYGDIIAGGEFLEPLAAALMKNWYDGAPKNPYTIDSGDVKGAMLDESGPKAKLKSSAYSWPTDPVDGSGNVSKKEVGLRATSGVYYHAFGGFSITLTGSYDCDTGSCEFDGTWTFSDTYD
jgi:hypothetical protein